MVIPRIFKISSNQTYTIFLYFIEVNVEPEYAVA